MEIINNLIASPVAVKLEPLSTDHNNTLVNTVELQVTKLDNDQFNVVKVEDSESIDSKFPLPDQISCLIGKLKTEEGDLQKSKDQEGNINVPSICSRCDATFEKRCLLRDHALKSHPGITHMFKCPSCPSDSPKKFVQVYNLKHHMLLCHTDYGGYPCKICGKRFVSISSIRSHMVRHTGERKFICQKCSKDFFSSSALKIHLRKHATDRPFNCEICQSAFKTTGTLNCHRRLVHDGKRRQRIVRSHQCKQCPKAFYRNAELVRHMISHIPEKKIMCEVCAKMFKDNDACLRHMRVVHIKEEDEISYQCHECYRVFKILPNLRMHLRHHFGKNYSKPENYDKEKTLSCPTCNKTFEKQKSLQDHILCIHKKIKPFKCSTCERAFINARQLKYHERHIHLEKKKHGCPHCSNRYSARVDLISHLIVHTEEWPYHCEICRKRFRWKSSVRDHMEMHKTGKTVKCEKCNIEFITKKDLRKHACKK